MHVIVSRDQALAVLDSVRLYRKLASWLALHASQVPTSRGVVVLPGERRFGEAAVTFAQDIRASELLLRSDQQHEVGRYPRGGYLINARSGAEIEQEVQPLLKLGRAVFLLEPFSPFDDLYSVNALLWPAEDIVIEVVGPGFDASDLKRDGISPHERLYVSRPSLDVVRREPMSIEAYRESWGWRVKKVGLMLERTPGSGEALSDICLSARETLNLLGRRGESMLAGAEHGYRPLDESFLHQVVDTLLSLNSKLPGLDLPAEPFALSMSYVGDYARPVYWDIVWPDLKYEGLGRAL